MKKTKVALITGVTGQDGSYLTELLLQKNYRVIGFLRKNSLTYQNHIYSLLNKIELMYGDLSDSSSLYQAVQDSQPDEIYNLAAQSHPGNSWNLALETTEVNGLGAHRLFDAVRQIKPDCRIYQASSSELFGDVLQSPQNEETPFNPTNPYAAAKLYVHTIAKIYRKSYGLYICNGILFNHESPRRGMHFITQKITYAAACIKLGLLNSPALNEQGEPIVHNGKVKIGNLDAGRDWGFAGDYVKAMWLMLQQETPDDYVIGTGKIRTIRDLCGVAFSHVNLDWQDYLVVDNRFVRLIETGPTVADIRKAKMHLNWQPEKVFEEIIVDMVNEHILNLKTCPR